jgi:hypothetical protein
MIWEGVLDLHLGGKPPVSWYHCAAFDREGWLKSYKEVERCKITTPRILKRICEKLT